MRSEQAHGSLPDGHTRPFSGPTVVWRAAVPGMHHIRPMYTQLAGREHFSPIRGRTGGPRRAIWSEQAHGSSPDGDTAVFRSNSSMMCACTGQASYTITETTTGGQGTFYSDARVHGVLDVPYGQIHCLWALVAGPHVCVLAVFLTYHDP